MFIFNPLFCLVSGSDSSLSDPPVNSPQENENTYFGTIKLPPSNDSSSMCTQYDHEFERFVGPKKGHGPTAQDLKACSQLGIMQPLEQLHTANLAFGIKLEMFFENIFRRWGTFVARNPWSIILASMAVSFYLAAGVYTNFQVTTDPVDLWVPLGSEARSDMEYFNKKFWKFYRIEQVLIDPKKIYYFMAHNYASKNESAELRFGPVFNQTFLLESFDLYQQILKITAKHADSPDDIKLDDICYKPLGGQCSTQSLFTYFHENILEIQDKDYLRRIQDCVE